MEIQKENIKNYSRNLLDILEYSTNWARRTSIHCIPNLIYTKSYRLRLIWFVCFTASLGLCSFQISENLILYLRYNVLTKTKIVNDANPIFPAVSFCSLNNFNGYRYWSIVNSILVTKNITTENIKTMDELKKVLSKYRADLEKLGLSGFVLENTIISCKFQNIKCDATDFEPFYDYTYGNCYRFNGGFLGTVPLKQSKQAKFSQGLTLELFLGDPITQQIYTFKSGVRIIVHNQSSIPYPDEEGIDISTGQQTNVAVSRTFINRLGPPFSDCLFDSGINSKVERSKTIQKMIDIYNLTVYDQNSCLKVCLQEIIYEECRCFDWKLPLPTNPKLSTLNSGCKTDTQMKCIDYKENEYYTNRIDSCEQDCPFKCNQVLYKNSLNTASYPSYWYYTNELSKNKDFVNLLLLNKLEPKYLINDGYSAIQQSILMVNVYYDNMYYTELDETPEIKIEDLIIAIGSNLGLFLGMSLLSFAELGEIFIYVIYKLVHKNKTVNISKTNT